MIELLVMATGLLLIILHARFKFNLNPYLRLCFVLFLISVVSYSISRVIYGGQSNLLGNLGGLYVSLAFAFVVMHSYVQRGLKRTLVLFSITLSFGLVSELLGVKYGWIYGSYHYPPGAFFFGLVPFMTPISWSIIIYMAFSMTSLIVPKMAGGFLKSWTVVPFATLSLLAVLSSIDGLAAMNLDLIMDPVAVDPHIAAWTWIDGGPYYGVPISNFVGWFLVTFFAMLIFRTYESFSGEPRAPPSNLDYYPAALYFSYFLSHATMALSIDRPEFVLIGIGTMMPFCVIVAYRYLQESAIPCFDNPSRKE